MTWANVLLVSLHVLGVAIWVGGMFYTLAALRPAAMKLEPPQRLALFDAVLPRFFRWVWVAIALIVLSGYHLIFAKFGGFAALPLYVNLMHGIGLAMAAIFAYIFFIPFKQMRIANAAGDLPGAARRLNVIRHLIHVNLGLGTITIFLGAGGQYA